MPKIRRYENFGKMRVALEFSKLDLKGSSKIRFFDEIRFIDIFRSPEDDNIVITFGNRIETGNGERTSVTGFIEVGELIEDVQVIECDGLLTLSPYFGKFDNKHLCLVIPNGSVMEVTEEGETDE